MSVYVSWFVIIASIMIIIVDIVVSLLHIDYEKKSRVFRYVTYFAFILVIIAVVNLFIE